MVYPVRASQDRLLCSVTLALALAIAAPPRPVVAGGKDPGVGRPGPRWSNTTQHRNAECLAWDPGFRADYQAGRDAWGRRVAPADLPSTRPSRIGPTVEVEVGYERRRGSSRLGGSVTAEVLLDPPQDSNADGKGGPPRHCIPSAK